MTYPSDGSAASGLGFPIMTGLEKVWELWKYVNSVEDLLANFITSGSLNAAIINSGILDAARIPTIRPSMVNFSGATVGFDAIAVGGTGAGIDSAGNASLAQVSASGPLVSPWARGNGISGGLSIYVRGDGVIGIAASSRRFKKDIKAATIDVQAVLAMRVVRFRYKVAIDPDAELQHGLIAEELDELGLTWLVAYDDDGQPLTVHYEKLALALLPVVQEHERRIAKLEEQINA